MTDAHSYSSSQSLYSLLEDEKESIRSSSSSSSPLRSVFKKFNLIFGSPKEKTDLPISCQGLHTLLCMHRVHSSIFGVSIESMQCMHDSRGNFVPAILLLLQKRLYARGGLQTEGIFRVCGSNLDYGKVQVSKGVVPENIDVHCLAELIKMWFRELPCGLLDTIVGMDQPIDVRSYVECRKLVKLLPATEAGLLDWVVNLMADVVQEEEKNKMTAVNIAKMFGPNFDQTDYLMRNLEPVTNFLVILIVKMLKDRTRAHFSSLKDAFHQEDIEDKQKAEQEMAEKQETKIPLLKEFTTPETKNDQTKKSERKKRNQRRRIEHQLHLMPKLL